MPTMTTFLTYDDQAETAAKLYVSIFDGQIVRIMRGPGDSVLGVDFELFGSPYIALNGGPTFRFSPGISLFVSCDTQDEIDRYWSKLLEAGGSEVQCGWITDRFGVSWQIVPKLLGSLLASAERDKSGQAMQAMLQMKKLDIGALQRAYDGA